MDYIIEVLYFNNLSLNNYTTLIGFVIHITIACVTVCSAFATDKHTHEQELHNVGARQAGRQTTISESRERDGARRRHGPSQKLRPAALGQTHKQTDGLTALRMATVAGA